MSKMSIWCKVITKQIVMNHIRQQVFSKIKFFERLKVLIINGDIHT